MELDLSVLNGAVVGRKKSRAELNFRFRHDSRLSPFLLRRRGMMEGTISLCSSAKVSAALASSTTQSFPTFLFD